MCGTVGLFLSRHIINSGKQCDSLMISKQKCLVTKSKVLMHLLAAPECNYRSASIDVCLAAARSKPLIRSVITDGMQPPLAVVCEGALLLN